MGYKDDADAAALEVPAGFHQLLYLFFAQGGGRLVHNNHFRINEDRLGDLNHLLHAHAESACRLGRVYVLTEGSHDLFGLFVHCIVIKQAARPLDPLVDKDIVGDAQQLLNVQLLVHTGDTGCRRFVRVFESLLLAVDINLALVGLMYAGQHLDQRGLARAVLTNQAQDFARLDREVHLVERENAGEAFHRVFQFNYIFTHSIIHLFSSEILVKALRGGEPLPRASGHTSGSR